MIKDPDQKKLVGIKMVDFSNWGYADYRDMRYVDAVEAQRGLLSLLNRDIKQSVSFKGIQHGLFENPISDINGQIDELGLPKTPHIEDMVKELEFRPYFAGKGFIILNEELNKSYTAYPHNIDVKRARPLLFALCTYVDKLLRDKYKDMASDEPVKKVMNTSVDFLRKRKETDPSIDVRGTGLERELRYHAKEFLNAYNELMGNRDVKDHNTTYFAKYVLMVSLLSIYDDLVYTIGRDNEMVKRSRIGGEIREINLSEKIDKRPKYWHYAYFKKSWNMNQQRMWGIVTGKRKRRKS